MSTKYLSGSIVYDNRSLTSKNYTWLQQVAFQISWYEDATTLFEHFHRLIL